MKTHKKHLAIILAIIMVVALVLVACPTPTVDIPTPLARPVAILDAETEFTMDSAPSLTAAERQRTLLVLDYIDLNGVERKNISFSAALTEGTGVVSLVVTQINAVGEGNLGARFLVNAQSGQTGTAIITLTATMEEEVVLTIPITVTVIDSTITATSTLTQEGFTLATLPSPVRNQAFNFSITLLPTHIVEATTPPVVTFTVVGTEAPQTVTGVRANETDVFNFTIPATQVTGNITLTNISGIIDNPAPLLNVEGLNLEGDFTIIGNTVAFTNQNYTFTVQAPDYYTAISVSYRIGATGTVHTLQGTITPAGPNINAEFTVPMDQLATANVDTDSLVITAVNLMLGDNDFGDNFFNPTYWTWTGDGNPAGTGDGFAANQTAPTYQNGILTFTDTTIRNHQAGVSGPHISVATASNAWSQISFEVNTAGTFDMALFATAGAGVNATNTNWHTGNWLRLFSTDDGRVNLGIGQNEYGLGAQTVEGVFTTNNWNRIDLVYRRVDGEPGTSGQVDIRLFVNGVLQELIAPDEHATHDWGTVHNGAFRITIVMPNYGHRVMVRTGEENTVAFRRIETPLLDEPN